MITPALFVKLLETTHPKGDRARVNSNAWRVLVSNGEREFFPVDVFSCFSEGYYFDKPAAVKWAWDVATTLGVPVSVYRYMGHGNPDQFVEDLE